MTLQDLIDALEQLPPYVRTAAAVFEDGEFRVV